MTTPSPFEDDRPTGPIPLPQTLEMPISKPLPPRLSWAMAELRPHLELMAARFRGLQDEIHRVQVRLDDLQRMIDTEVETARAVLGR